MTNASGVRYNPHAEYSSFLRGQASGEYQKGPRSGGKGDGFPWIKDFYAAKGVDVPQGRHFGKF